MESANKESISEMTLEELFPQTLTDTNYVFLDKAFCSIAIAGDNPSIESTSGLSISPKNCLA